MSSASSNASDDGREYDFSRTPEREPSPQVTPRQPHPDRTLDLVDGTDAQLARALAMGINIIANDPPGEDPLQYGEDSDEGESVPTTPNDLSEYESSDDEPEFPVTEETLLSGPNPTDTVNPLDDVPPPRAAQAPALSGFDCHGCKNFSCIFKWKDHNNIPDDEDGARA
eukprot:GDKK01003722.1.p2 GENE.GDKK01003722.1~~GDKK01003722.1.p2  ORF type:complete len:169 (-),score=13.75 GDKK01003722.1:100-606(-)